ncbi:MAG: S9 family peptidase [Candidatus Krumholzibacteriota bacterium]|nr:S9 family peptidase [Candidatus Krumholzibacteriota bacterium]
MRNNDIWTYDLASGAATQVTRDGSDLLYNGIGDYIDYEEVGRERSFWWSPDGASIAFVQADVSPVRELLVPDYTGEFVEVRRQARPVAGSANSLKRLGVVSLDKRKTTWIGGGDRRDEYIVDVSWRPGGRDLLVDAENGSIDTLFTERDPAWVNVDHRDVHWSDDGRLLWFTAERPAWNHIYRYDTETGETTAVTSGAWEVTAFHGVDGRGAAWYTATALEPEQRHLYRTELDGRTVRVTPGEGWYESHPSPGFDQVLVRYDNPLVPWDLYALASLRGESVADAAPMTDARGGGHVPALGSRRDWPVPGELVRITDSRPDDLAGFVLPVPRFFTLESRRDGKTIHACILLPPEIDEIEEIEEILAGRTDLQPAGGRRPAIVTVHGGGYAQSVVKGWRWRTLYDAYLVARGYVILDLDYRGSSGYGRDWRTDVYLDIGGPDLEDEMTGLEFLGELPFVDPERVGIWGWSYGGYMTALAMLRYPDAFRAGAAVAPVTCWRNYDTHYTEERLGMPEEQAEAYRAGSPVTYAKSLRNHLLIAHAMGDDNVHFQDTVLLVKALIESGTDFEVMFYPTGRHGIRHDPSRIHLFRKITRHFDRFLHCDADASCP